MEPPPGLRVIGTAAASGDVRIGRGSSGGRTGGSSRGGSSNQVAAKLNDWLKKD